MSARKTKPGPETIALVSPQAREGRTTVASAAAHLLRRRGLTVGVMVPVALDGRKERTRLISGDAELLSHYAEAPESLSVVAPYTQADDLLPFAKSDPARIGADVEEILRCHEAVAKRARVVLVEVHGGLLMPIARREDQASLLTRLGAKVVVVASAAAARFNLVMTTIACAKERGLAIDGVALNRYDPDRATLADETNPEWIELHARVPTPVMVPHGRQHATDPPRLDPDVLHAVGRLVERWGR